jgi:hypothetical protein
LADRVREKPDRGRQKKLQTQIQDCLVTEYPGHIYPTNYAVSRVEEKPAVPVWVRFSFRLE